MKDLEAHELAKLEEQKELEEKKQTIELKEVCGKKKRAGGAHSLFTINKITNHLPSHVCVHAPSKAEKAQLLSRPDQIFKEAERKSSRLE